jgi:hypothetical protein
MVSTPVQVLGNQRSATHDDLAVDDLDPLEKVTARNRTAVSQRLL